jgi:sugar phosphate permease
MLLYIGSTISGAAIIVVLPFLREEKTFNSGEGLTERDAALILASRVGALFFGKFVVAGSMDCLPAVTAMSLVAAVCSTVLFGMSRATDTTSLVIFVFMRGVMTAGLHPSIVRHIYSVLDSRDASRAYALLGFCSRLGAFTGQIVFATMMRMLGSTRWSDCFLVAALPLFALSGLTFCIVEDFSGKDSKVEPRTTGTRKHNEGVGGSNPTEFSWFAFGSVLAKEPVFWHAVLANTTCKLTQYLASTAPLLLKDSLGVPVESVGFYAAAYPLGSAFGCLVVARKYSGLVRPAQERVLRWCPWVCGSGILIISISLGLPSAVGAFLCSGSLFVVAAAVAVPYYVEITGRFAMTFGRERCNNMLSRAAGALDGFGYAGNFLWGLAMGPAVTNFGWGIVTGALASLWVPGSFALVATMSFVTFVDNERLAGKKRVGTGN